MHRLQFGRPINACRLMAAVLKRLIDRRKMCIPSVRRMVGARILTVLLLIPTLLAGVCRDSSASSASPGQTVQTPYIGLLVSPISIQTRIKYELLLSDPGAEVIGVDDGSPAARARLRSGDLVLSANGQPLWGQADLQDALARLQSSTEVRLVIRRGNRERDLVLQAKETPKGFLDPDRGLTNVEEKEWVSGPAFSIGTAFHF